MLTMMSFDIRWPDIVVSVDDIIRVRDMSNQICRRDPLIVAIKRDSLSRSVRLNKM